MVNTSPLATSAGWKQEEHLKAYEKKKNHTQNISSVVVWLQWPAEQSEVYLALAKAVSLRVWS